MQTTTEVKQQISFRLTTDEKKQARIIAAGFDMSVNEFSKYLLLQQLKKAEKTS